MYPLSGEEKKAQSLYKIDQMPVDGLNGVANSLAYKVHEIEKHLHNKELWFGKSADQSGVNLWATSVSAAGMRTAFRVTSGSAAYGADASDEAQIWGLYDVIGTDTKLDLHELFVTASSVTTIWYLRVVYGSGTLAAAITAGQYSEFPLIANAAAGGSIEVVVNVMMPRITIGTDKIWIQGKNATDNATLDLLVGVHSYSA